jgi:DNA modification methylase
LEPEEFEQWTLSTWFINPETRSLGNHPAVFPEELVRRAIKLWTYRGDVILDPFSGTGTTALMAKRLSRKYIGIDKFQPYIDYAEQRLSMDYDAFADDKIYVSRSERLKKRKMPINKEMEDCFD